MDVSAIRQGLQTRLATIGGLRNYAIWPDTMNCPAALVHVQSLSYMEAMQVATVSLVFEIVLLVAPAQNGLENGQTLLDGYLDDTGANSIRYAVSGDISLGSTVDYAVVTGWRDYGVLEVNGIAYVGVKFDVVVNA